MLKFPRPAGTVPAVTRDQMQTIDRLMVDDFGIEILQMMENAGRSLAVAARELFLKGRCQDKVVVVLAGHGGNGGGALACARRLHIWGARVGVVLSRRAGEFAGAPAQQLAVLQRMGLLLLDTPPARCDLLIDGLIGYNLRGAPRGRVAELIGWANRQIAPTLALDLPSGLDATTGAVWSPCIRANATLTLALPKTGLLKDVARPMVGELYLADISVPGALYAAPGVELAVGPVFAEGDILKVR